MATRERARPACERVPGTTYEVGGALGEYLGRVTEGWLLPAPEGNPGMLEMFRDRDRLPPRNLVPWAGEFAGKYLTSAVQVLRLTRDGRLRSTIKAFVAELVSLQDESGYLGPWPREHALTNAAANTGDPKQAGAKPTWDTWGHYHVLLGLLLWSEESGDRTALRAATRIADLLCDCYLGRETRLVDTGSTEMNLAPVHALALLYRRTGSRRHLELAEQIVHEFGATTPPPSGTARPAGAPVWPGQPLAGDYLEGALMGKQFHELPKPRWESLHPIMGLAELHRVTGERSYRRAFEHLWWSIRQGDRHNNGGFSSGEKATGNPYDRGAIESCCTVAWIALSVEMLKLTAGPAVADELELATLNSGLGMHSPSGRWATYNTPMDGLRLASAHEIVFQSREGTPELNCCSVNASRGLGMVSDWAVVAGGDGALYVNWYGPGTTAVPGSPAVTLIQETGFPRDGRVRLRVIAPQRKAVALRLRIPAWSARTKVLLNGERIPGVEPGSYLAIDRRWSREDCVELRLDMSLHLWSGARECEGLTSVYRGPVLLTWDRRFNDMDPANVPTIDLDAEPLRPVKWKGPRPPVLLLEATGIDGRKVRLADFASAGNGGTPYRSWLPVRASGLRRSCYVPGAPGGPAV